MPTISEDVYNEILESLFNQVIMIKKHEPDHKRWIRNSSETDDGVIDPHHDDGVIDPHRDDGVIDPHRDPGGKITEFRDGRIVNNEFVIIKNTGEDFKYTDKNEIMYILAHLIEANLK